MGRVPYSEFVGSRARFQRLSDQRIFSGWLQKLVHNCVEVTTEAPVDCAPNERVLFQVQGPSADAYFIAVRTPDEATVAPYIDGALAHQVVNLPGLHYNFTLITQIQLRDAQQQARRTVEAMTAKLSIRGHTSEVLITDASAGGMGILIWEELEKGDVVEVAVSAPKLEATFMAQVKHCRPEGRIIGAYRVGLEFQKPDRLSLVGWRKLINPL